MPPPRDAPVGEEAQRAGELAAVGGERVLHAHGRRRVGRRDDDPGPLEAPEPVRQDVRRDARDGLRQLVEPTRARRAAPRRAAGSSGRRRGRAPWRARWGGAGGVGHRAMVGEGLADPRSGSSRLQITSYCADEAPHQRGTASHVRAHRAPGGRRRRRDRRRPVRRRHRVPHPRLRRRHRRRSPS